MPTPTNFEYLINRLSGAQGSIASVGGKCIEATAGATLNVGDYVYWSAVTAVVNKSTTITNYGSLQAGVVVGGRATGMKVITDSAAIAAGFVAALVNQEVLIQVDGIAYVVAGAAITAPLTAIPSAVVAGRVASGTTAGQKLGVLLDTAAGAGSAVRCTINPS